jgi:hypothetical protein
MKSVHGVSASGQCMRSVHRANDTFQAKTKWESRRSYTTCQRDPHAQTNTPQKKIRPSGASTTKLFILPTQQVELENLQKSRQLHKTRRTKLDAQNTKLGTRRSKLDALTHKRIHQQISGATHNKRKKKRTKRKARKTKRKTK